MTEAEYVQTIRKAAEDYLEAIRDPAAFRGAADQWTRRIQYWAAIKDKLSPHTAIKLCDLWLEKSGAARSSPQIETRDSPSERQRQEEEKSAFG